ncbi:MAG TPA: T9SS type A sorting domain-containing protein, partial [Cytophagaceae bacterium]
FFNTGSGSADRIGHGVANITFEIGTNNPGAIGLRFYGNNYGGLYNVAIRALDNTPKIGLDKGYSRANGPTLTKDILIEGFKTGVKTDYSVESEVYEHMELRNQTEVGWLNGKQILSLKNIKITGCKGAAFINEAGFVNMLNCDFSGISTAGIGAIRNDNLAKILIKGLNTTGYARAIDDQQHPDNRTDITGMYLSDLGVSYDGTKTYDVKPLNLEVRETPVIAWETDTTKWVNPIDFGATSNGRCGDNGTTFDECRPCDNDAIAIQAAIDATRPGGSREGATTLYISGAFRAITPIILRGSIRRVVGKNWGGVGSSYYGTIGGEKATAVRTPTWQVGEQGVAPDANTPKDLEFVNLNVIYSHKNHPFIKSLTGRTLIFKNCELSPWVEISNSDVFFESCATNSVILTNCNTWARQLNCEGAGDTKINVNRGTMWCLGFKTEQTGPSIVARGHSKVEVYGAYLYDTHDSRASTMITAENSDVSASIMGYTGRYGKPFGTLVKDIKSGEEPITLSRVDANGGIQYPSVWNQCNDASGDCNGETIPMGSTMLLYSNVRPNATPENWIMVDDRIISPGNHSITYSAGQWQALGVGGAYQDTERNTSAAGATADFTFTGDKVAFYAPKDNNLGTLEVFLDNMTTPVATIDLYAVANPRLNTQLIYMSSDLTEGQHTLRVKATGAKNSASSSPAIRVDGFEYRATKTPLNNEFANTTNFYTVYPNPASNELTIKIENESKFNRNVDVKVMDVIGNVLISKQFDNVGQSVTLPVAELPTGSYFVNVRDEQRNNTTMIVITR